MDSKKMYHQTTETVRKTPKIIRERIPERHTSVSVWIVFAFSMGLIFSELMHKLNMTPCP